MGMKVTKLAGFLLLGLMVLAGGCGSKTAKTPKDAAKNVITAINTGDRDLFLANVEIKPEDRDFAGQMFDTLAAMKEFADAMKKAYGEDALKKPGLDFSAKMPTLEDIEKNGTVKEEGDKATLTLPKEEPMRFVKIDGVWKAKMDDELPPAAQRDMIQKQQRAMIGVLATVKPDIGKPGMTPEKIQQKLSAEMMKAAMESRKNK